MSRLCATAKRLIRGAAAQFGVDVRRKRDDLRFLHAYGIRTVLDVGANTGQFAGRVRRLLPEATIHCFEPLDEEFRRLTHRMAGNGNFHSHRLALGDIDGETVMYHNEFSPSSSLLPLSGVHLGAFPQAARTTPVKTMCTTLDNWARTRQLEEPLLIKIDVQGYEDRVIGGGARTVSRAVVLFIEVSFAEVYVGQKLFDSVYDLLRPLGFRSIGMLENVYESLTGRILQADAIFERT